MNQTKEALWDRFKQRYTDFPSIGLAIDLSRMNYADDYLASMDVRMKRAFASMATLERGAIANPDENRMVGHYWLRTPSIAPTVEIRQEIETTIKSIKLFATQVHSGEILGQNGKFENLLIIGIGGSALGPQFVSRALAHPRTDKMSVFFFDNTDPDGMERVLAGLDGQLGKTLCIVISKSGSTKETRNGMIEAESAYTRNNLEFRRHAVAITGSGSNLDKYAKASDWIKQFPMWDWVGGRTSELSAVGLLPAALQGFDIDQLLSGASKCDELTRISDVTKNPAGLLTLMWFYAGKGKGLKDMVILPYRDRLELFSKYLQQLIMESIGKENDKNGNRVNQGISVFGNKGATDQHSYIQQLRDGLNNFFAVFIEVLQDKIIHSVPVEDGGITSGDYLQGFFIGTRNALYENGRESITITLNQISPFSVGVMIALFERAVGLYASLIEINAYHQPGVEAGKRAAEEIINLKKTIIKLLESRPGEVFSIQEIAKAVGGDDHIESVFKICQHLSANPDRKVLYTVGRNPFDQKYRFS